MTMSLFSSSKSTTKISCKENGSNIMYFVVDKLSLNSNFIQAFRSLNSNFIQVHSDIFFKRKAQSAEGDFIEVWDRNHFSFYEKFVRKNPGLLTNNSWERDADSLRPSPTNCWPRLMTTPHTNHFRSHLPSSQNSRSLLHLFHIFRLAPLS